MITYVLRKRERGGAGPGRGYRRLSSTGDPAGQNVTERPATLVGCPFAPFWQLQLRQVAIECAGMDWTEWNGQEGGCRMEKTKPK